METTAFYLHQFGGGGRAYREQSYREFAQTARAYGIRQIWFKAFQGGKYATWDPSPLGLSTLGRIKRCYEECAAEGIEAVFWGVPQANSWQVDATIANGIGSVAGNKIHIDLENFKDFWNAPAYGVLDQPRFFKRLKEMGLTVDVSAVMRFGEPSLTPWAEIRDLVDTVWTQSYWTDFREPAVNVVRDDVNTALALGIPADKLGVIFPHNGSRADLDAALEVAQALNVRRVAVWVWDWAGLTPFEFLRSVSAASPAELEPEPEPPILTIEAALSEIWRASQIAEEKAPDVAPEMETIRRLVVVVKDA